MARPLRLRIDEKTFPPVADRPAQKVLADIELTIAPGSFVVLTGPSGCGKSTLLNVLAGLDESFTGSVDLGSDDPKLAFMFQTPRLLPWRTVEENIALVIEGAVPGDPRVAEIIGRVGLTEAANAYPERLSLGMQRRAALARAFVLAPDILLMDEPFVSLDDPTADSLRRLLIELWTRRPTTVLFVTHDRTEAVMLATRVVRVDGRPATVVQDEVIDLSVTDRANRERVLAVRARVFAEA
ncbi:MAG: ATP-binding cassette domain-containing protein [Hyphomicrobiaceae bacterium]|nr:ATP-binding cassette domain-containing protein [Hyphomicrobiaceae bacterium]